MRARALCPLGCGRVCRSWAKACTECWARSRLQRQRRCLVCDEILAPGVAKVCGPTCLAALSHIRKCRKAICPRQVEAPPVGVLLAWAVRGEVVPFRCESAAELASLEVPAGAALWAEEAGEEPYLLAHAWALSEPGWLARQAERLWALVTSKEV